MPGAEVSRKELKESIGLALSSIDGQLATRSWLFVDPERGKALSRARDFLQRIREGLDDPELASLGGLPIAATKELVDRASSARTLRGRENTWDFSEELRVASWTFLSDDGLTCLLEKEKTDVTNICWTAFFSGDELARLLHRPRPEGFREGALSHLRRLHHERVDRVRHDRARDKLWQHFVWKLIPIAYLLLGACMFFMSPRPFLPVMAGAIGSMLSGVIKVRDGEQRIRHLRRSASFLLLQPMIGATAALVMIWLGVSNILNIHGSSVEATLGFLAGFSEPFFLGTIGRLADMTSSSKSKAEAAVSGARSKANP